MKTITVALACALSGPAAQAADRLDPLTRPIQVAAVAARKWNDPQEPVRIYGNTWYVGVAGLSAMLVRTERGAILIDGDLPQSVPLIETNLGKLGVRMHDIRFILNSHAHYDHAGGIAALARDSGAEVVASASGATALRAGHAVADDPQAAYAAAGASDPAVFPAVTGRIREIADGGVLRLGAVALTAHLTPGHTPGSTTWTWTECEDGRCLQLVYADSLNAISAPGFHFLADETHPDLSAAFRKSIQTVAALPCDILITVHPDRSGLPARLKAAGSAEANPFVDPEACSRYARESQELLDARITEERAAAAR